MMSLPPVRATDREREDAADALRAAFSVGCIDSELTERAARAYSAVTRDELHDLVRDLPGAPRPPRHAWAARRQDAGRALGWEFSLMLAAAGAWLITAVLSGVAAVPFIMLWLVALRALGILPRLALRARDVSRKQG